MWKTRTYLSGSPEDVDGLLKNKDHVKVERIVMYEYDDKITAIVQEVVAGKTESGKTYRRFKSIRGYSFRIKQGKYRKFLHSYKISKGVGVREVFPSSIPTLTIRRKVYEMCVREIGQHPENLHETHALVWYWKPLLVNSYTDPGLSKYGLSPRYSSAKDITKKVFGISDKRITKEIMCHENLGSLFEYKEFLNKLLNLYGVETVLKFIHNLDYLVMPDDLSEYLKYIPKSAMDKFSAVSNPYYLIGDTLMSLQKIYDNGEEFTDFSGSIYNIHDRVAKAAKKVKEKPISYSYEESWTKALDHGFILPETSHDLLDWSMEFSNCSSSYSNLIKNRQTTILRHPGTESMIEVKSDGTITQILKKYNKDVSEDEFFEVINSLIRLKLVRNDLNSLYRVWGRPRGLTKDDIRARINP